MTPKPPRFKAYTKPGKPRLYELTFIIISNYYGHVHGFYINYYYVHIISGIMYRKNHKSSEIVLARSSRGSHIFKTLVKQKTEIMNTNQKQIS